MKKIILTLYQIKSVLIVIMVLGLGIVSCSHNSKTDSTPDQIPAQYQSILISIKEQRDKDLLLNSGYFLYDITGDGIPELWTSIGTCEADTELKAYTIFNGKTQLIYDGAGGHSDYFVFGNQLNCVMCNTGAGVIITYDYNGKCVTDSSVEFSTWNDEGKALSEPHDSIADKKLMYWEDNYDNYIKLKPI